MLLMDAICQCVSIHRERALQLQRVVDDMPLTLLCGCGSQIAKAAGPAGPNYEYLFRLEEALYEIGMLLSVDASYFNAIYDDPWPLCIDVLWSKAIILMILCGCVNI